MTITELNRAHKIVISSKEKQLIYILVITVNNGENNTIANESLPNHL